MSEPVSAFASLPQRLLHHSQREATIAYLAACDLTPAIRRKLYRAWCNATMSSCRREDLARVAPPRKPREVHLALLKD